jgi:hypothetical protein
LAAWLVVARWIAVMDTNDSPAAAAPSYRERVVSHLSVGALVLVACTGVLSLLAWSGTDRAGSGTWPEGTSIKSLEALQLSEAETADFDASVFGDYGRSGGLSLSSPRLPAMLPGADESLWQSGAGTELRQQARTEIGLLQECARRGDCSPAVVDQRGREAVKRLGQRGLTASLCDVSPRESEGDKRVPIGLLAAALSWVGECRARAIELLTSFEQRSGASRLAELQRDVAAIYARFNRGKLRMDSGVSGVDQEYLAELRAIRTKLLDSDLAEAYRTFQEQERWGLSMAEIHAEWMLAEARAAAGGNRGNALDERIAALKLFELVPPRRILLGEGVSAGEARLRSAWCALTLRFKFENETTAGFLPACIVALATEATFPPELRCAFGARDAVVVGDWQPDAIRYCDNSPNARADAAKLMERVAGRSQTWKETLQRYATLPAGPDRRASFAYLDAYAVRTDNRITWFGHEHPALFGLIILVVLTVAVGWCWWLWALLWRRRALWRLLPPELAADR